MTAVVDTGMPRNAVTGDHYAGANIPRLLTAQLSSGYASNEWAGFKQWLTVGRCVRKGEHGTACRRVIHVPDRKTGRDRTAVRGFVVFNREQTTELGETTPAEQPDAHPATPVEVIELTEELGQ